MVKHCQNFIRRALFAAPLLCVILGHNTTALAWGKEGHSAIGILAMTQLQADARQQLAGILNPQDERAIAEACNWPDMLRETEEGASTGPRHYINIPRGDFNYLRARDCPHGQCATEAIKHDAQQLANREIDPVQRWQAFAWLCHVVGDLHQPLHAGFADDRGANNVDIVVNGEEMNLQEFWDHELIDQFAGDRQVLVGMVGQHRPLPEGLAWSEAMVDDWTNDSHELAKYRVYPPNNVIDHAYTQRSWTLAEQRLSLAAYRLAWIINTVFE